MNSIQFLYLAEGRMNTQCTETLNHLIVENRGRIHLFLEVTYLMGLVGYK